MATSKTSTPAPSSSPTLGTFPLRRTTPHHTAPRGPAACQSSTSVLLNTEYMPLTTHSPCVSAEHQGYFIVFSILTALSYIATVLLERYLRHARYIPGSLRRRTTVLDILSLACAVAGSCGLVLLSIFNTFAHGGFHWSMTALFLAGTLLSVLLQTLVVYDLAHSHASWSGRFKILLWPATFKLTVLVVALIVAIAFGVLYLSCSGTKYFDNEEKCSSHIAGAAGCEWTIAFLLVPYLVSYAYDFYPAREDLGAAGFATTRRPAGISAAPSRTTVPLVEGFDPSQPSLPASLAGAGHPRTTYPLISEPYLSPVPSNVPSSITVVPLAVSEKDKESFSASSGKLASPASPAGSDMLLSPLSEQSDSTATRVFFPSAPPSGTSPASIGPMGDEGHGSGNAYGNGHSNGSAYGTTYGYGYTATVAPAHPAAAMQAVEAHDPQPSSWSNPVDPRSEGTRHRANASVTMPQPDLPHLPSRGLTQVPSEIWR